MTQDKSEHSPKLRERLRNRMPEAEYSKCIKYTADLFSAIFLLFLIVFIALIAAPVILEDPSNITPDAETYSDSQLIGVGDVEGGYEVEVPSDANYIYQERLEYDCSPSGDRISTGGSFNCDYRAVAIDGNESQGLVEFDREFLNSIWHQTIVAEWTKLSPEGETSYVTYHYGYSSENTLNGSFRVYTPSEAGQYEFRLLLNSKLNPHGNELENSSVIASTGTELFVYSEEQSASFTTSEAFYQLERIAVIGIIIAWFQLIVSFYKIGRQ